MVIAVVGGTVGVGIAIGDGDGESDGDSSSTGLPRSGDGGAGDMGGGAGSTAASMVPPMQQGASSPTMPVGISNRTRCAGDIRAHRSASLTGLPFDIGEDR